MSFLKFWGKKEKKDGADGKKDDGTLDPELEKRKLRHSLSISRSGRFKQKKRERGQVMDKPELFSGQDGDGEGDGEGEGEGEGEGGEGQTQAPSAESSPGATRQPPASHAGSTNTVHPRSPNTMCRDVNKMATGRVPISRSVVT